MDPSGRNIVVTGAARGIGLALATAMHAAGANVVLADLDGAATASAGDALDAGRPGSALGVRADVASEAANKALIATAREAFGPVDIFFANAGIVGGQELHDTTEHAWQATFDINVNAHRWAAKHLVPEWLERGEGYFCSTASAAGLLSQIGSAPYSVTKHAAVAFAEWLAISYGDRGVRVSVLCPQGVNTDMLRGTSALVPGPDGAPTAGTVDRGSGDVVRSAGAVLEPDDVAAIVLQAVRDERFAILPHPEVLTYWRRKTDDYDRWIGGMRRLQARVAGGP